MKYPELVTKLTTICSAWIVGGAINSDSIKDYDLFIPMKYWREACALIPKDANINRMGGFKCISENIEVDVWTGFMSDFLASNYFLKAYHPQTGVLIERTNAFEKSKAGWQI